VLHLAGGIGKDFGIGIGGGAGHVATIGKQVRRAPKELGAAGFHLAGKDFADFADVAVALGEAGAFGGDIGVVEAEEWHVEQVEQLERHIGLEARAFHALVIPGAIEGAAAKRVAAFPGKSVPIGNAGADMILHALAEDDFVLVVVAI